MIEIANKNKAIYGTVALESSKSISNRLLIIKQLSKSKIEIQNLSTSNDTKILSKILNEYQTKKNIYCQNAGTALRFVVAFLAAKEGIWKVSGSKRMHERPIKPLIDCLAELGTEIKYLEKKGFPPIEIRSKKLKSKKLSLPGDISSQFISALLLVAPTIENGLNLEITSKILSKPYINMTLDLMNEFGIEYSWKNNLIKVQEQSYLGKSIHVENDWSAASFWYSFLALSKSGEIKIPNLYANSIQGDSILSIIYSKLGIKTEFNEDSIILSKTKNTAKEIELDLSNHPDLALPIIVTCAGLGTKAHLMGLESLKIKESNRLECIKTELEKFNVISYVSDSSIKIIENQKILQPISIIECHDDHRIPMSIAPLIMKVDSIKFTDKEVVNKSYPKFWQDLRKVGIG
ncbi:MAG: 3-phosphoshikimate 1-carboxyvinyltransferase [Crocinitomicaceae bacterium]|nr:3-phosphoshikimate 1-carboxyvinyltransferase [Crocinitomicaceae bacterium]|tara:strand:- start:2447 stop:3661 length:1215 start_codon:yes stop_codon:yes gene_type:complete